VANAVEGTVSRIDPQSSRVVATIGLRGAPTAIAAGPSGVWVVSESADLVVRIDPATNQHLEIPIDGHPTVVSVTRNDVWVAEGPSGRIVRIDQRSNRVMSWIAVGGRVDALSADDQSVWVAVHGS
jgi:DNA-binding beta-propeller fold protein YncE